MRRAFFLFVCGILSINIIVFSQESSPQVSQEEQKLVGMCITGSAKQSESASSLQGKAHPGIRARQNQDAILSLIAPQFTVCPSGTPLQGIDVSHWNGSISWSLVHLAGISFAYAKAGEGNSYTDPTFLTNFAGAKAAGVIVGGYYFFRPGQDPTAQANNFLNALTMADFTTGDLVPCVDFEVTDGQSQATIEANLQTFVNVVRSAIGVAPVIYTSPSFWNSYGSAAFSDCPLWIANWDVTCPNIPFEPWTTWVIWQYSDSGMVSGIPTEVDLDESNGVLPLYGSRTGTIWVEATLNGEAWIGPLSAQLIGSKNQGIAYVPHVSTQSVGTWHVTYNSGGPYTSEAPTISPSVQTLVAGGTITFTLAFTNWCPATNELVSCPCTAFTLNPTSLDYSA